MASSLAAQLVNSASLNASILLERTRKKPIKSYLFTGRDADEHDLDSIHALGVNGLLQLSTINSAFRFYLSNLFSESSRELDRTLLSKEQDEELNGHIASLTRSLGPYLLDGPAGKVLEWLVRRFRIHEFNVLDILALFLPYHDTPHFQKMVTLLKINDNSTWSFLIPYASAARSIPRQALVTEMLKNSDVARFVVGLLPESLQPVISKKATIWCHRTLITFNTATVYEYLTRVKSLDESMASLILPSILEPLHQHKLETTPRDSVLGSYVLLCALSQKCTLASKAIRSIMTSMASAAANENKNIDEKQFIHAAIAFCAAQDLLNKGWTETCIEHILSLPGIINSLVQSKEYIGFQKFVRPLLVGSLNRLSDEEMVSIWQTLLSGAPVSLVQDAASLLISKVISTNEPLEADTNIRRILRTIYQRYPDILHQVIQDLDESDEIMQRAEQLVMSLSMVFASSPSDDPVQGALFAVTDADVSIRAEAIKELVRSLQKPGLSELDKTSIYAVLLDHVRDTEPSVVQALYETHPSTTRSALQSDPITYINHLRTALLDKPKRAVLKAHLTFLFSSPSSDQAFHEVVFPQLMPCKPKKKSVGVVWEVVAQNPKWHSWLAGCERIWIAVDGEEEMATVTNKLADRIAENIMVSNEYAAHFDALVIHLEDTSAYARAFSHLIAKSLLSKLSGEQQLKAANRIVHAMNVQRLPEISEETLSNQSVLHAVMVKPNSRNTIALIQASILALIPTLCKPSGLLIDWFADTDPNAETYGAQYVYLMRAVYRLAAGRSSVLVTPLFINLQDDCLLFLLGLCIATPSSSDAIIKVALQHVAAFLEAHEDKAVDFQTVVPALLVVLEQGRLALDCIELLSSLAKRSFKSVYKFDTMYSTGNDKVQYLDREEYMTYITALNEYRVHFENDPEYLKVFHQSHLGKNLGDKKKQIEYKEHILCYLLSHVVANTAVRFRIQVLKSLTPISHKAKGEVLQPLLTTLLQPSKSADPELAVLILASLDISMANHLNGPGTFWPAFKEILHRCFESGPNTTYKEVLHQNLESGLFAALSSDHQIEIAQMLLGFGSSDATSYAYCRETISTLVQEPGLIVQLLSILQPKLDESVDRASKRTKLQETDNESMGRLTLFAEVLSSKDLPGSLELVSQIMSTLHDLSQYSSSTTFDVNYIQQLLMMALGKTAEGIQELPNLSPSAVKLEVLVEVIRTTDNPQTFHQALLLIATLTRLSAESVLHNVMPVFTFMGSNVFHRDDSYSFQVVQKTIESIVPVMVNFLKNESYNDKQELYIRSREFLRTFTDATNHIPRHRRIRFFIQLVDALGADDFLAPVTMLIVDKFANRVVRQSPEEIANTLALPVAILQHYPSATRFETLRQIVFECKRITKHITNQGSDARLFLEAAGDAEHSIPLGITLIRQAQALITFVGFGFKAESDSRMTQSEATPATVVNSMLTLIAFGAQQGSNEVSVATRAAIHRVLEQMFVSDFVDAVQKMLRSEEKNLQIEAFNLIASRLPLVAERPRTELAQHVSQVIEASLSILSSNPDPQVLPAAFKAITVIGQTTKGGEEPPLTNVVPIALQTLKNRTTAPEVLLALQPLVTKLGPRVLPYTREIVEQCISILQQGQCVEHAINVLHALLTSIPTFWRSEELQMVTKYCIMCTQGDVPALSLVKTMAKRVPTKVLLPSLSLVWAEIKGEIHQLKAFFELLSRTLRSSPKIDATDNLRPLFSLFLEGLETLSGLPEFDIEFSALATAFTELTSKLSDVTFRPLFRRLHDWAMTSSDDGKKDSFCRLYITLQDHFKAIMNPYMAFLLQPFVELLGDFSKRTLDAPRLWSRVITVLNKSFLSEDGSFWNTDKLRQIAPSLIQQAPISLAMRMDFDAKGQLMTCLTSMVELVTDDSLLKLINLGLLMHTRSEDVRLRLLALTCSENLWSVHGEKLIGFASETATFIAECAEDSNDMIVKQSKKLKSAVEAVSGAISGL